MFFKTPFDSQSQPEISINVIYQLALHEDENALDALVKKGVCLSKFDGPYNAIMLLAREGKTEAVDLLITKYLGNINHALQGYAMSGNELFVDQLINNHDAIPKYAVLGYACGGHDAALENLLEKNEKWQRLDLRSAALMGYAIANNKEKLKAYLEKSEMYFKAGKLGYAARGLALAGNIEGLETFLGEYCLCQEDVEVISKDMLEGFAMGNHSVSESYEALLDPNYEYRSHYENELLFVKSYAMGGHPEKAKEIYQTLNYRKQEFQKYLVDGLVQGGHIATALQMLNEFDNDKIYRKKFIESLQETIKRISPAYLLELMVQTKNLALNRQLELLNSNQYLVQGMARLKGKMKNTDRKQRTYKYTESLVSRLEGYSPYEIYQNFLIKAYTYKTDLSEEFKESLLILAEFLTEQTGLVHRLSRDEIVAELLSLILDPDLLNQAQSNVCGVAIFLHELAEKSPLRFVMLGLQLAKTGKSNIPFANIESTDELNNLDSLALTMMCSIRHFSNISGYSKNSMFERLLGATLPKDFELWFERSGFEIITDNLTLHDGDNEPISTFHRFMLGGLYSDKHVDLSCQEKYEAIQAALAEPEKACFLLISSPFAKYINSRSHDKYKIYNGDTTSWSDYDTNAGETILGIDYGHYVKVLAMGDGDDADIKLSLFTWGESHEVAIPRSYFEKHCQGIMITGFNTPFTLAASNREDARSDARPSRF